MDGLSRAAAAVVPRVAALAGRRLELADRPDRFASMSGAQRATGATFGS